VAGLGFTVVILDAARADGIFSTEARTARVVALVLDAATQSGQASFPLPRSGGGMES